MLEVLLQVLNDLRPDLLSHLQEHRRRQLQLLHLFELLANYLRRQLGERILRYDHVYLVECRRLHQPLSKVINNQEGYPDYNLLPLEKESREHKLLALVI